MLTALIVSTCLFKSCTISNISHLIPIRPAPNCIVLRLINNSMSLTCVLFEITFEILHKELFCVCVCGGGFFLVLTVCVF